MEPLFVTECKFDDKSYYEMVPILRKKPPRIFLIFTPVIILIMIFFLVLWGYLLLRKYYFYYNNSFSLLSQSEIRQNLYNTCYEKIF